MSERLQLHYLWGGRLPSQLANSVQVMKMCEAMAGLGHAVTLYHSSPGAPSWNAAQRQEIFATYGVRQSFELCHVPSGAGVLRHWFGLRLALRMMRRARSNLVFSRFLPAAAWCSLAGIATIHELHVPPGTASERLYMRLLLAGRGFRKLVAITQALAQELRKSVSARCWSDIIVEADGVNLDDYRAGDEHLIPADIASLAQHKPLVGYIGSLHPGKGAELIVPLAKLVPGIQFIVVGGPDELADGFRQQAQADGAGNISWLGHRKAADVPAYVQACDVVLLPNQRNVVLLGRQNIGQWTSPLKLFEYMAAGRIILASDLPVLREILNEGNAVLCDPEDPPAWARALSDIAQDLQRYTARAEQARSDVVRYSWAARAARCMASAMER